MKRLMMLLLVCGTVNATEKEYGYGSHWHGYNSRQQEEEAHYWQRQLQLTNQNLVDMAILQKLNGGQPPENRGEMENLLLDTVGEE